VYVVTVGFGAVFSFTLLTDWRAWYFPGDPDVAEIAIMSEAVAFGAAGIAALLLVPFRFLPSSRVRVLFAASLALPVALAFFPLVCVAHRHFGEWSDFRTFAWGHVAQARARGVHTRQFKNPPEFRFARWSEPVKLRAVTSGRWPTVLLDFGNGGTAEFDLRTMWCTYTD
jgi:hypothetical protein